jgi:hypothetical protein
MTAYHPPPATDEVFYVPHWLWDEFGPQIGPYGLSIMIVLHRLADHEGKCCPSHAEIAKLCAISRRQVIRTIPKLEQLGLVAVTRNGQASNIYALIALKEG